MNYSCTFLILYTLGVWGVGSVPVLVDLSAVESLVNEGGILDSVLGGGGGSAGTAGDTGGGSSGFDINDMVSMLKGITGGATSGGGGEAAGTSTGGRGGFNIGSMIQAGIPLLQGFLSNMSV